jgi:hypothetical protein
MVRFGVAGAVEQYMTPERVFERALFRQLERFGYRTDDFNDRRLGTHYFDAHAPEVVQRALTYIPPRIWRWFLPKLDPWGGFIPMRLDWFAGRGLSPLAAHVVARPFWGGEQAADHDPIAVDLALGEAVS